LGLLGAVRRIYCSGMGFTKEETKSHLEVGVPETIDPFVEFLILLNFKGSHLGVAFRAVTWTSNRFTPTKSRFRKVRTASQASKVGNR
jgi:hypothetical protein